MASSEDLYAEGYERDYSDTEPIEETGDDEDVENQQIEEIGDDGNVEENQEEGNEESKGDDEEKKEVKPKKPRMPRLNLNAETLKGKRGLTALSSYFDRVKFKGKGYEEQDLGVILKTYEYWCHRLFPKYPFEPCISKIEQLGTKRATVTHIKKIRADLIFDEEPTEKVDNLAMADDDGNELDVEFNSLNDVFDTLRTSSDPVHLTEEQREQIRLNKEKAMQRRREQMQRHIDLSISQQDDDVLEAQHEDQDQIPVRSSNEDMASDLPSCSQLPACYGESSSSSSALRSSRVVDSDSDENIINPFTVNNDDSC